MKKNEKHTAPTVDPNACNTIDPRNNARCVLTSGHVGVHSNGKSYLWKDAKATKEAAKKAKPQPKVSPLAPCDVVDPKTGHLCILKGEHEAHQMPAPAPKPETKPQRTRAENVRDAGFCGAEFECNEIVGKFVDVCTLAPSHYGRHENTSTGMVEFVREEHPAPPFVAGVDAAFDDSIVIKTDPRDLVNGYTEEPEEDDEEPEEAAADEGPDEDPRIVGYERSAASTAFAPPSIKTHPAADALPLIEGAEFDSLVEDIRANGLRHKPVLDYSMQWLVDGRNRKRACEQLGISFGYEILPEGTNIAAFVISTNLKRRHLTESQRAMIASEIANLSQGQKKQTRPVAGLAEQGVTQAEAAAGAGVGERTVQRANAVRNNAVPELVEAVKQGKVDLKGAEQVSKLPAKKQREIMKERIDPAKGPVRAGHLAAVARQEERREVVRKINEDRVAPIPIGPFGIMLWDPPWDYDNSDDHPGARGHIKYPPMTEDAIIALGQEALSRLRDDAVIVTWATNVRMPAAVHVIEALGLTWQSMGTWVKDRIAMGPLNMRSRTEHYIIATRGKPTHTLNEVSTWLGDRPLQRGGHSVKPAELHELIEKHCSGPFLEIFARGPRDQWATWGAEVDKFASEAA